jgi:hypothetical protein
VIECAMCRRVYDPDQSAGACASCTLLTEGCGKVKCPYCGYENQRPLRDAANKWFDLFRKLRGVKAEH